MATKKKKNTARKKPASTKKSSTKKSNTKNSNARKKATNKKTSKKVTKKKATKKTSTKKTTKKATGKKTTAKAAPAPIKKTRSCSRPKNTRTLSYTRSEFVQNVMGYCGIEKKSVAKELCDDFNNLLVDCLKKGYKIPLLGVGKLYVRKSKARMGRNPATGAPIRIPAKKRVKFSVAKAVKEAVL